MAVTNSPSCHIQRWLSESASIVEAKKSERDRLKLAYQEALQQWESLEVEDTPHINPTKQDSKCSSELEAELKELKSSNDAVETEVVDITTSLDRMDSFFKAQDTLLNAWQNKIQGKHGVWASFKHLDQEYTACVANFDLKICRLQAEEDNFTTKLSKMRNLLLEACEKKSRLSAHIQDIEKELETERTLTKPKEKKLCDIETASKEMDAMIDKKRSDFLRKKNQLEEELKELEKGHNVAMAAFNAERTSLANKESELIDLKNEEVQLQNQLKDLEERTQAVNVALQDTSSKLEKALTDLGCDSHQAAVREAAIDQLLNEMKEKASCLKLEVAQCEEAAVGQVAKTDEVKKRCEVLEADISHLFIVGFEVKQIERQCQLALEETRKTTSEIQELKKVNDKQERLNSQIEDLRKTLPALKDDLDQRRSELSSLKDQVVMKKEAVSSIVSAANANQSLISKSAKQVDDMKQQLLQKKETLSSLQATLDQKDLDLEKIKMESKELNESLMKRQRDRLLPLEKALASFEIESEDKRMDNDATLSPSSSLNLDVVSQVKKSRSAKLAASRAVSKSLFDWDSDSGRSASSESNRDTGKKRRLLDSPSLFDEVMREAKIPSTAKRPKYRFFSSRR